MGELVRRVPAPLWWFLGTWVAMSTQTRRPVNLYDEGLVITGAMRVLSGELPNLDFWRIYPPGAFYLTAGEILVARGSFLGVRLIDAGVTAAIVALLATIAGRLYGRAGLLGGGAALVVAVAGDSFAGYPVYPALALCLLGILLADPRSTGGIRGARLASGVVIGLASAFRLEYAFFAALAIVVAGLIHDRRVSGQWLGGVVLGGLPMVFFTLAVGPAALWDQLIAFPATNMSEARGLPLPGPDELASGGDAAALLSSLLVLQAAALVLAIMAVGRRHDRLLLQVSLALLSGLLVFTSLGRFDLIHAVPALLVLVVVTAPAAVLAAGRWRLAALAALAALLLWLLPVKYPVKLAGEVFAPCDGAGSFRCVSMAPDAAAMADLVRHVSSPHERIYVGLARHDRVMIGDQIMYSAAGRLPAVSHDEMHPLVTDMAEVQAQTIQELEDHDVRFVVLWDGVTSHEPNASSRSSGEYALDRYMAGHFTLVERIGSYQLLVRTS